MPRHRFFAFAALFAVAAVACNSGDPSPSPALTARSSASDVALTASARVAAKVTSAPTPEVGSFAVLATRSIAIKQNVVVNGGNVGAAGTSTTDTLAPGETLAVANNTTLDATKAAYGAWLELDPHATAGSLFTDHLAAANNASYGALSPFVVPPSLPPIDAAAPGQAAVKVPGHTTRTLAPGAYGAVTLGAGATLVLTGGSYQLASLTTSPKVQVLAQAASKVEIDSSVEFASNAVIEPTAASGLTASALQLIVAAPNCAGGDPALHFDPNVTLRAIALAPQGTLTVGQNGHVTGALGALDVDVEENVVVGWEDGLAGGTPTCSGSCDDGNACTADACTNGTCTHTAVADGTSCTGTNLCEQTYACQAGQCVGSNPVTCSASDSCHVAGTCDPGTGKCSNPAAPDGTTCDDGNACTQTDTCHSGACGGANPVTCAASDQCHVAGTCDPTTGACSNPAASDGTSCNDGNACTQSDTCQAGACTGANPVTCAAPDQCHVAGVCDPASGTCSAPAAPDGTACNDGNACTQTDACVAGVCAGTNPVTCATSDQCHVAGSCNPATGTCSNPSAPNGTSCNDGNACTQTDTCQSGSCTGGNPVTCTASDQCHVAGTCEPSSGKCSNPAAANGTTCNDGDACTQTDTCQAGTCAGSNPVVCAADQCHSAGTCNPATGACINTPTADGTPCTGTDRCNQDYTCTAGACVGKNPVVCTASDQCHVAGTCDPASGACSNPAANDGTSCNDGNACTQSDSCQSGTCTGANPVACAALDACHTAGSCNPTTGQCSNPTAADGTACGTADGGVAQVCTAGTCGAAGACNPGQTTCNGACVSTQTDPANCGTCGNACAAGYTCAAGTCVSPAVMASCLPAGSVSVLDADDGVTAYVPNGSWSSGATGVQRVVIEGGSASIIDIPTPLPVNSCASNWVTGETVCTSNQNYVYLIHGSTLTTTVVDGATGSQSFSGGSCATCGVSIDASTNTAILQIGILGPGGRQLGGYQMLDLNTNTLGTPVSAGVNPTGDGYETSEDVSVDPVRHIVLSPNEAGDYQVLQTGGTPAVFDNVFPGAPPYDYSNPEFDSAAEDCSTGIALSIDEKSPGLLALVDMSQAKYTAGSPGGKWSAPFAYQDMPGLPFRTGQTPYLAALSVAPGTHLGIATAEYGGGTIAVYKLPSSSGSGTPSLVDWAGLLLTHGPNGTSWNSGGDPHALTAYRSPRTGHAMGVLVNSNTNAPPSFLATVDLQGVLDAPRLSGTHNIDPAYDLVANGVVTFTQLPCSQANTATDPNNCGACGNVCPTEPNSLPACVNLACKNVCFAGYADCNANAADGCEVNLESDPSHCGACNVVCGGANASGVCTEGQCSLVCNAGYSNCDGNAANGCETQGPCTPPTVSIAGPTSVVAGAAPSYTATVSGTNGRTMSYAWTSIAGPAPVRFASPAALTTAAEFTVAGTYTLQFEATDGFTTASATLAVTATYVNQPPVITLAANQTVTAPTMTATLTGTATDDSLPQGASLAYTWSLVSGPVAVTIAKPSASGLAEPGPVSASTAVTFAYPGTYVFQLDVSDGQLDATATTTVQVNAPAAGAGTPPTVAIGGVSDDQEITKPTAILGTVSDGAWVLEERLGGRDDVSTSWTVMASGTGAVGGTKIATFDPTLLLNGIYTLRLSATNSAGSAQTSVSLSVDGRMKIGNFSLAFTDLDTAVMNLPLSVTRTYDSRDKRVGDFGVGWWLGIRDVRVEKSGKTGAYWQEQFIDLGIQGQFCLTPRQASSIAITFPSGRQYRFTPQSSPQCQYDTPITAPDIVWTSTSDPNNPTIKLVAAEGSQVLAVDAGYGVTQLQDSSGDIWDPRRFTLTIEDGSVWQIDQDLGVTAIQDRNGNTLTISPSGIHHSSGKDVKFVRDAKSRITAITDPNGKSMTYAYDANGDLVTYTDRASNVTQFAYAANHYLTQIQDPLGRLPIRNDYDGDGRLIATTDAAGNTVHYAPNLAANQERVTDRLGHSTTLTYNDRGDITQKIDATGAVWKYTYDIRGNQLSATDPLGHTKSTVFDGADNVTSQTDELGNTTTNTYTLYRQLLTSTDPLGHTTTNVYDGATGNLLSVTDPIGNTTHYTYDPSGNVITETDALNNVTRYQYDASGHVTLKTDALGHTTTSTYDADGHKTSEVASHTNYDGSGTTITTKYVYDDQGHLTQRQKVRFGFTSGPMVTTTYTPTGKRATQTDELGRVTRYDYDELDRLVTTTLPDGTKTSQTYDAENHRLTSTDAAGNTTTYVYDGVGRVIRTTFADGSAASTTYDGAGRIAESVDELGHVQWVAYDAAGRRTSVTDALGNVTRTTYDAAGNQTAMVDPLGHETTYAYDAANRAVATVYPDGTADSTRYDALGRVMARTNALGHSTEYAYDALGRLVTVTDELGNVTTYGYDEVGQKIAQTDANKHTTVFTYDPMTNAQTSRHLPDGSVESFADDAAGQIVSHTDFAGHTTTYGYDGAGRVTSRAYPDSTSVSFTYTPTGQRATMTDARGTTTYAYDNRNRLTGLTYPDGRSLSYGYDAHGNRTALAANVGGTSLSTATAYDADGRPNKVTDPLGRAFNFSYDAAGNRVGATYPNGTSTRYTYDALDRLTNLSTTTGGGQTVQSYAYTLDAAGKRTRIDEGDGTVRAYGYDSIDRLTSEQVTGSLTYAKTFTYDSVGNRLTQTTTGAGAASVAYAYDSRDRLTTEGTTAYAYDANGNVTSKAGEAAYGWDFDNRLASVRMTDGTLVEHAYDADGNRVQTSVTPPATGGTTVGCQGSSAVFVREDTATQGSWQGVYGADGHYINAESAAPPSYGAVAFTGSSNFTWTANTSDVRALQQPPPATLRIASTYYTTSSETFHVVTTDGHEHTVALYMLDWDNLGRTQTVTAQTATGTVVDAARPFGGFSGGVYAVYRVCGSVDFTVSRTGGPNAVVSGIFFGAPPGTATTTNMLVDAAGALSQVVAETDASGKLGAVYVRAGDELLEVLRPGTTAGTWSTRFVHVDALGTVRVLTDESGATTDTRAYEAFGTRNAEAGGDTLPYGFAGEPLQRESRLAYHRARWMDSRLGRFDSFDPLTPFAQPPGQYHPYTYADAIPTMASDPSGKQPFELLFGKLVEERIFADFAQKVPGGLTNSAIQRVLGGWSFPRGVNPQVKAFFGVGLLGRPDLANPSPPIPTTPYIFEIKPLSLEFEADLEVDYYLFVLNSFDDRPMKWRGGLITDYDPPNPINVLGIDVNTWVGADGVILYYADPDQSKLRRASGAIMLGAAIGVAMLVAQTTIAAIDEALE